MKKNLFKNKQEGSALMVVMVLFVGVSLSVGLGLTVPVIRANRIATNNLESKRSYFISESGIEDVYYRLKNSLTVGASETLTIGSSTATTTTTDISGGRKTVQSVGITNNRYRTTGLGVSKGEGVSFNYGVQSGRGGIVMGTGSSIVGNVYSNGSVTGAGSVTASAVAANSNALLLDQQNDTPSTPASSIIFGNSSTTVDFAQSFQITNTEPINKISLYIKKTGAPGDATVRIVKDSNGSPGIENMMTTQGTLSASSISASYGWVDVTFSNNPTLYSGTTYWIVLDMSTSNGSKYYTLGANTNGYANGSGKTGVYSGAWNALSPSTLDSYFKLYTGGILGTISGIAVGQAGVGDSWAHTISGGSTAGTKYCVVGTSCNTSRADPMPVPYPVTDADIQEWKDEAALGATIEGNYTVSSSMSMGPKVINGNLTVSGNNTILTLTGVIHVKGNFLIDNNAIVKLDSSYGSDDTVVISDGRITISNNATFQNSGTAGSYVMAITTSDCPISTSCSGNYAINIANNAGAVVLNAQRGTINISNNSSLTEATGEILIISNNATVTYVSGLVDMFFSSGPAGTWSLDSWKEQ